MIVAVLAALVGVALVLTVLYEAVQVMQLPRRGQRRARLVPLFFGATWGAWSAVGRRFRNDVTREAFLSHYGPLSMVLLLVLWSGSLILGFGIVQWAVHHGGPAPASFGDAVYTSGTTFFTLGFGDLTPTAPLGKALAVIEAGTGFGLIAVIIGYLPVLYQLFSRRETHVILLDARAGSPPTGVALLLRHARLESMGELDSLLREWERWAAELVESHLSYPMLGYYRSQYENQSWLAALTAILDACAVMLTGLEGVRTFQARMTFAAARLAVVEMVRVFRLHPREHGGPAPVRPSRLSGEEFARLQRCLAEEGIPLTEPDAEETLGAFRAAYEPFLVALAAYLISPLPPWTAPDANLDNWQRSRHGREVKDLIDEA